MTAKKEYDIYGNLILSINVERFEYEISSENYERCAALHPHVINESKGTALFTDGYCDIYTYDERNNVLTEERFSYWGLPNCKRLSTYLYSYSEDGRVLERTEFREEIPLLDTGEEIDETIEVIHLVNKYDDYNNLIEENSYVLSLPGGSDKRIVEINKDMIPRVKRFKNIYNEKGELIQVIDESKMELISKLSYISGKLDTKVVYIYGEEEKETIKYFYSEDCLIREEYYSECVVLLKIIEHVNIRGRMCRRLISPARDNLRWYLLGFSSYHGSCDLYVEEEILTAELLASVYNYVNEQKSIVMSHMKEPESENAIESILNMFHLNEIIDADTKKIMTENRERALQENEFKSWMDIELFNPVDVDMNTYGEEIYRFTENGKKEYNIDFRYFRY